MEKYETLWRRIGAFILDSIILSLVSWGILFVFLFTGSSPAIAAVSSALVAVVSVSYSILLHTLYGQTVGKMAAKVKVLDDSENPINFGQAVLRSLPQLVLAMFALSFSTADADAFSTTVLAVLINGSVTVFFIGDVIVFLVNEKRRALHDFIAGTIVVRTDV